MRADSNNPTRGQLDGEGGDIPSKRHLAIILLLMVTCGCKSPDSGLGLLANSSPNTSVVVDPELSPASPDMTALVSQVRFDSETQTEEDEEQTDDPNGEPVVVETAEETLETNVGDRTGTNQSLEMFEAIAIQSHPSILQSRAQVQVAQGRYSQAGLPFNPVLQYMSDEIGNEDSSGIHSVAVSQQFVTANKLGIAQQVQAQEIQKRQAELRRAELMVLTRVRTAFAKTLVAQERKRLTLKIVELSDKSTQSVQLLLEAQEVSKVALLQVKVEAQEAKVKSDNAATQLEASRRSLAAAAGMPELSDAMLVGDLAAGLDEAPWESLIENIQASSPELSAAGSAFERAKWSLQLACAQATPNVTGQAGIGVDTTTDDTFASIGFSVPLPIHNRNQGNIRAARANVAATAAVIDQTRLDLETRLADAVGRYQMARERFQRLRDLVLPSAEETYQLSISAMEAGESSYLQLLTAQRTLFTTQLSALSALEQALQAKAEIAGMLVTLK